MTTSRTPCYARNGLCWRWSRRHPGADPVIWQLQTSPETNDAYVYADTIDVVPEVSGRIVEMPIRDNQRVKKAICCSASTPSLSGDAR